MIETADRVKNESISGEDEIADRLLRRLGEIGIYPDGLEVENRTVALRSRSETFRVRVEVLDAGVEASLGQSDRIFLLRGRPFSSQIRALCRWGGRPERKGS